MWLNWGFLSEMWGFLSWKNEIGMRKFVYGNKGTASAEKEREFNSFTLRRLRWGFLIGREGFKAGSKTNLNVEDRKRKWGFSLDLRSECKRCV